MFDQNDDKGPRTESQAPMPDQIVKPYSHQIEGNVEGKTTSGNNPDSSILITISLAEIVPGNFQAEELSRFANTINNPASQVITKPMCVVKKAISHLQSSIIVIDDGCGKTTILDRLGVEMWGEVADETAELLDPDEWVIIPNAAHEDTIVHDIWSWIGSPLPSIAKFKPHHHTSGRRGSVYIQLRCHHCRRRCVLTQVEKRGIFAPSFEDDDIQMGLDKIVDCPQIRNMILNNISTFKQNLVIEVPKHLLPNYIRTLRALTPNRKLIFLCPPGAQAILHETFPDFLVKIPEPLSVNDLLAIYCQRLVDAGMRASPLPPQAVLMLALMSEGNARRFVETITDLVEKMEADDITETVSLAWVGSKIGWEVSGEIAIQLTLSFFRASGLDWISYTELQKTIRATFGLRLTGTAIGRILSDIGVEKERRGKNKMVGYHIGDFVLVKSMRRRWT